MPPAEFYQIKKNAYILTPPKDPGDRLQPEEEVRQWCAFELIRVYGIRVTEMDFERPVRTGSRNHFIDILVSRGGRPWAVVECKARGKGNPQRGMKQAISYANALEPKPQFAVYADGDTWLVCRLVAGEWIPVADLPMQMEREPGASLTELLHALDDVTPLISKLDEPLVGKEAKKFLQVLQVFFHGSNLLTRNVDRDLLFATDNVLRVLWTADHPEDDHYRRGKLGAARRAFETYSEKRGLGFARHAGGSEPIPMEMRYLRLEVSDMIEGTNDLEIPEILLVRLNVVLLDYGAQVIRKNEPYPALPAALHQVLRHFLNVAFASSLNTTLPDAWDTLSGEDLKSWCASAWNSVGDDDEITVREVAAVVGRSWLEKILFWRRRASPGLGSVEGSKTP